MCRNHQEVCAMAATRGNLAVGSSVRSALFIVVGILSIFTGIILNALTRRK
jgi:hypothetical protein